MSEYEFNQLIQIPVDSVRLEGVLSIPKDSELLVVFVHGSGSSRHSPRNNHVAKILNKERIATFLFDLLTEEEDINYQTRFDIEFLKSRLLKVTDYLLKYSKTKDLKIGYFGASTGAAAAISAAEKKKDTICSIVSRGGRPDLALDYLKNIKSPILLIVGGEDFEVIEMNKKAFEKIKCEKKMEIVPGATHLFEEGNSLDVVANLAANWFKSHENS